MSEQKSAFDIITSGAIAPDACLTSVFEIENILLHVQKLNTKITHLKGLKKYRVESAGVEIKHLEEQVSQFRELIKNTMLTLEPEEKTLQFPSIAKVSRREEKAGWDIKDEEEFLQFLDEQGKKSSVIRVKEVVDKKIAKKLISEYADSGVKVPGVEEIPASISLSITFEDNIPKISSSTIKKPKEIEKKEESKPSTKTAQTLDDLESLEV